MDDDQKFMEEFYKNNIMNKIDEELDDKSELSYDSDNNEFDFDDLNKEFNNNLKNTDTNNFLKINEENNKSNNKDIQWKYKKIENFEKLLDKYYITNEGLLILKNLPSFDELTDEQKFYELKKNKFKLYNNVNFDKNKYAQQNPNGLFVAGDGRLNKKKYKEMRMKKMQRIQNMILNNQKVQNNNFIGLNLKRK